VIGKELEPELMNIKRGRAQIFRAISNLISNARDAMQDIGNLQIETRNFYVDQVKHRFGHVPRGEYVRLAIADSGSGIDPEVLPKIFDPFFTTKATDKRRGTGLGLSVVHAVIEDHQGYMDIETKLGQGTTVYLYFPITREKSDSIKLDAIVGGDEKILIVDDDRVQREVTSKLLTKLGYTTQTVTSGEEACRLLSKEQFDLLILDMVMPDGIDGAETFKRILKKVPEQKAIIVSGYAESDRVALAQKLGAGPFIRKPLTLRSIARAVRMELDRKLEKA
jgi:CheY-like chemotaxis protein